MTQGTSPEVARADDLITVEAYRALISAALTPLAPARRTLAEA